MNRPIVSSQTGTSDTTIPFTGRTLRMSGAKLTQPNACPALQYVGYSSLDARSKNIEVAMKEKDQEIVMLKKDIKDMKDEWHALLSEPEKFITMLQEGRGKDRTN